MVFQGCTLILLSGSLSATEDVRKHETNFTLLGHHFHIFPKAIYQIVDKYNIDEFHLSMTQGFWDRPKWGPPFVSAAPGGAEVWAWLSPNTPK